MSAPQFVLASASPRRRQLLQLLNIQFECVSTEVDETSFAGESALALVKRLSRLKARAAHSQYPDSFVIAADTDVELNGNILGKPRDAQQARDMLRALRGRDHTVYGGFTILGPTRSHTEREHGGGTTFVVQTRVWMREYTDAELESYVATGDPLDKAAAYAVQHDLFHPVARFEGCYANVMGLALCRLWQALAALQPLPDPCLGCHLHPAADCSVARLVAEGNIRGS
jgi:nucleoside triphosphate pyrophosphatase